MGRRESFMAINGPEQGYSGLREAIRPPTISRREGCGHQLPKKISSLMAPNGDMKQHPSTSFGEGIPHRRDAIRSIRCMSSSNVMARPHWRGRRDGALRRAAPYLPIHRRQRLLRDPLHGGPVEIDPISVFSPTIPPVQWPAAEQLQRLVDYALWPTRRSMPVRCRYEPSYRDPDCPFVYGSRSQRCAIEFAPFRRTRLHGHPCRAHGGARGLMGWAPMGGRWSLWSLWNRRARAQVHGVGATSCSGALEAVSFPSGARPGEDTGQLLYGECGDPPRDLSRARAARLPVASMAPYVWIQDALRAWIPGASRPAAGA